MKLQLIATRIMTVSAVIAGSAIIGAPVTAPLLAQDQPPEVIYLFADLSGDAETAAGDADGFGDMAASVKPSEGQFCYELSVGDIAAPTAAHVHEGKDGADGPPVITISVNGGAGETCVDGDAKLLKKIADNPGEFYVNVHNAVHPAGAIRGQLQK